MALPEPLTLSTLSFLLITYYLRLNGGRTWHLLRMLAWASSLPLSSYSASRVTCVRKLASLLLLACCATAVAVVLPTPRNKRTYDAAAFQPPGAALV